MSLLVMPQASLVPRP